MMSEICKYLQFLVVAVVIMSGMVLAGCSAGNASQPAAQEQTVAAPASPGPSAGTPPGNGSQPGSFPGRPGSPDMSKMLSRAAEILGITEASLTSAFQQAQESILAGMPGGTPGQLPPNLFTDNTSVQRPPQPPAGSPGQQPPGGFAPDPESTQKFYSKMAEILSISADKIAGAMEQARQELQGAGK